MGPGSRAIMGKRDGSASCAARHTLKMTHRLAVRSGNRRLTSGIARCALHTAPVRTAPYVSASAVLVKIPAAARGGVGRPRFTFLATAQRSLQSGVFPASTALRGNAQGFPVVSPSTARQRVCPWSISIYAGGRSRRGVITPLLSAARAVGRKLIVSRRGSIVRSSMIRPAEP